MLIIDPEETVDIRWLMGMESQMADHVNSRGCIVSGSQEQNLLLYIYMAMRCNESALTNQQMGCFQVYMILTHSHSRIVSVHFHGCRSILEPLFNQYESAESSKGGPYRTGDSLIIAF